MDTIVELVRFAKNTKYEDLPKEAVDAAKMLLKDIIGVSVAGTGAEGVAQARRLIDHWGGREESTVLFFGEKLPVMHAAFLNSLLSHARDYDEYHPDAVVHTGISVIPTVLAVSEETGGISGREAIRVIAVTADVLIRFGDAIKVPGSESGWIYSALLAGFGAALAASLLLGLSEEETVHALGIAYAQLGGNQQAARDTTLTKRMQPALSVKNGVFAAYMAREGISGARHLIDGNYNFFKLYLNDRCDRSKLTEGLGKKFRIGTLAFKPYPVCGQCMTPSGTTDYLMKTHDLQPEDVISAEVGTNRHGYRTCVEPKEVKYAPQKVVDGQFSIPYSVSTMIVKRHLHLSDLTEEGIRDKETLAFIDKVEAYVDEQVEAEFPRGVARAKVTLHTTKGDFTGSVYQKGHPSNPFTAEDMREKFLDAFSFGLKKPKEGAAEAVLALIDTMETVSDVSQLITDVNRSFG